MDLFPPTNGPVKAHIETDGRDTIPRPSFPLVLRAGHDWKKCSSNDNWQRKVAKKWPGPATALALGMEGRGDCIS